MSNPLGFSVDALLPRARGGGPLKIGLSKLTEDQWLQPAPDLTRRAAAFDAYPQSVQLTPEAEAPADELAAMLGVSGGLEGAARSAWEDMCLLTRAPGEDIYRLVGAAVAFPSDWSPAQKLGLPLAALHAPIYGYDEQLASPVDIFMAKLKPGAIYGRTNWFIAPTPSLRWVDQTGPEDAFSCLTPENAGENLFVRCERQTLRRLPQTGAILFTIGIYVEPLGSLGNEHIAFLSHALATLPQEEAHRRGTPHYAPALQAYAASRATITE